MMALLKPQLGNWASVLVVVFVAAGLFLYYFTTVLFSAALGLLLLIPLLVVLYYTGLRIDRRLRHGKKTQKAKSKVNSMQSKVRDRGGSGGSDRGGRE